MLCKSEPPLILDAIGGLVLPFTVVPMDHQHTIYVIGRFRFEGIGMGDRSNLYKLQPTLHYGDCFTCQHYSTPEVRNDDLGFLTVLKVYEPNINQGQLN